MRKFQWFISFLLTTWISQFATASDIIVQFSNVNIQEARKIAGEEGKLLFVGFHADWCTPCKWMDQTTFKDEKVAKTLQESFISLKIDIDEQEGFTLKNTYDVKYLPTLLIFNSKGQLLEKVEETLSPRKLLALLEKYNAPENKVIERYDFNLSPSEINKSGEIGVSATMLQTSAEYQKYYTQPQTNKGYRVQVGVFERYEGAREMVNTLRQWFNEPVTVTNDYKDGRPVFKVRIGQFNTAEEGEVFRRILMNEYNMNGIVL